jgi:hypothetical protein
VFGVSERSCTQILTVCFKKMIPKMVGKMIAAERKKWKNKMIAKMIAPERKKNEKTKMIAQNDRAPK